MTLVLQNTLPQDMLEARKLPGIQPLNGNWIVVDDAYGAQMGVREDLLHMRREDVLRMCPEALAPAQELLDMVLRDLPDFGFGVGDEVICPDGRVVVPDRSDPLGSLGRLIQADLCLLEKVDAEHVLKGAVLCFPASWRLSEKINRPLVQIHDPVAEYDANLAVRVQRLFDAVRVGQPLWRSNRLWYEDATLFQPRSSFEPRRVRPGKAQAPFYRSERQTIFRLPDSGWVVFAIHTYVLRAEAVIRQIG